MVFSSRSYIGAYLIISETFSVHVCTIKERAAPDRFKNVARVCRTDRDQLQTKRTRPMNRKIDRLDR